MATPEKSNTNMLARLEVLKLKVKYKAENI